MFITDEEKLDVYRREAESKFYNFYDEMRAEGMIPVKHNQYLYEQNYCSMEPGFERRTARNLF